jgi:hypothetical protein
MLKEQCVSEWILLNRVSEGPLTPTPFRRQVFLELENPGQDIGMALLNQYVMNGGFNADERYCCLCDDDWYPPGFVAALSRFDEPLVVVSMRRGDHLPPKALHPEWNLIAAPQNLHYGHVGFEQFCFRGDVLNAIAEHQWALTRPNEDIGINAAARFKTVFAPELEVWFNWFEEGRWDK